MSPHKSSHSYVLGSMEHKEEWENPLRVVGFLSWPEAME